jgi:hypothetical protein
MGLVILIIFPLLGMPFTNNVAIAKPGGKFVAGAEIIRFFDKYLDCRN